MTQTGLVTLSFEGQQRKLTTAADAEVVVSQLNATPGLQHLTLSGNTFGVEACVAICSALAPHAATLEVVNFSDIFTSRLHSEIRDAVTAFSAALVNMPKLREINFSDNAFGPIGAERLSPLIAGNRNLEVIRVNNNGLGSIGGTIVAKALCELANSDQPVRLHTFVAGRNRLENKGATALAHAFTQLKTLRLIAMPQNGIHYIGIGKLAEAFVSNPGLQVIDLNDNTFTSKGGKNMAKAIASLKTLKRINFGDCLARKAGGKALIEALTGGHELLEDLDLSYNELKPANAEQLIEALKTLTGLKQINVLGNEMSNKGVKKIKAALASGVQYTAPDEDDEDDQSCDDDDDDEEEEESEAEPEEEEQEEEEAAEESVPASAVKPSATAEVEVLTGQVAALNVSAP